MSFRVESLLILNKHAEQLKATLYNINNFVNDSKDKILFTKEIEALVKAVNDKKTIDQEKFPHLSKENQMKYGQLLRESYAGLMHCYKFMEIAHNVLGDAFNESRNFDINLNYIYVIPVLQLFKNYFEINVMLNNIENLDRVAIVYSYCFVKAQKKSSKLDTTITRFLESHDSYKTLNAEMQQFQEKLYSFYNSIIPIMSRLLHAGVSYPWKELNINDNPKDMDENNIFYKTEILVMTNFKLLCDCFLYFALVSPSSIAANSQFSETYNTLLAHCTKFTIYGEFQVSAHNLIKGFNKLKDKKPKTTEILEQIAALAKDLEETRNYRHNKLSMILREYVNAANYDKNVLVNKLSIIQSVLGLINFEVQTMLEMKSDNPTTIPMIEAAANMIILYMKHKDFLKRFLVFNFREYDGPFLESLSQSFTIPNSNFQHLCLMVQAFRSINIEEYDNGQQYDLRGMEITLLREMSAFNALSKSRGVLHLAPLFTLISSIWFRVNLYNNAEMAFLNICELHKLWGYNKTLIKLANVKSARYLACIPSFLEVVHLSNLDDVAAARVPDFMKKQNDFLNGLFSSILGSIMKLAQQLQAKDLLQLFSQTKSNTPANMKRTELILNSTDKKGKTVTGTIAKDENLTAIPIGMESMIANRPCLSSLAGKIQGLNQIVSNCIHIGSIQLSNKHYNVTQQVKGYLKIIFNKHFESISLKTPYEALDHVQIAKYLFQNIYDSAQMNYTNEFNTCMQQLCLANLTKDPNTDTMIIGETGRFVQQFINMYKNFFNTLLPHSFFNVTAQAFTSTSPDESVLIQQLGSPAALRVVFHILGVKGIGIIDILAADSFTNVCNQLASTIKDSKLLDQSTSLIQSSKGNPAWMQTLLSSESTDPQSTQINSLLCLLGAIAKFRKLIRYSIPSLKKYDAESDALLIQKLKNNKILEITKNPAFTYFVGAMFASPFYADLDYNINCNAFTNNCHLIGFGLEALLGATKVLLGEGATYDPKQQMVTFLTAAYCGLSQGGAILQAKGKKNKWSASLMNLILDHIVDDSFYVDYSHLEQLIPYQTIRHIYTVTLANESK